MSEMIGADVDALDDLARRFETYARNVEQATGGVDSIVARMGWRGAVADEFRDRWRRSTRKELHEAAARFHQLARALRAEADQQRRASTAAFGGNGTGLAQWLSNRADDAASAASAVGGDFSRELDRLNDVFHGVGDTAAREVHHATERAKDLAVRHGLTSVLPVLLPQFASVYVVARSAGLAADMVEERTGVDLRAPARWVTREALGRGVITDKGELPLEDVGSGKFPDGYSAAEALASLDSQEPNTVRILQTGDADNPRYVVLLRGMDPLDWNPGDVNTPPQAVLQELLHGGAYEEAVQEALGRAKIPDGSEIMFIAHSQGGDTAMDLAADPGFNARYNVTHVLTAGSPSQDMFDNVRRVNPGAQMLALDNGGDPVPAQDIGIERSTQGASHVVFGRDDDDFLPHDIGAVDSPTGGGYAWIMDQVERGNVLAGTDAGHFASTVDSMYFGSPPSRAATAHMGVDGGILKAVLSR